MMFDKHKKFIYVLPQKRRHNLLIWNIKLLSFKKLFPKRQKNMNLLLANNIVSRSVSLLFVVDITVETL